MGELLKILIDHAIPALLPEIIRVLKKREEDPEFKAHLDAWADQAMAAKTPEDEHASIERLASLRARS